MGRAVVEGVGFGFHRALFARAGLNVCFAVATQRGAFRVARGG